MQVKLYWMTDVFTWLFSHSFHKFVLFTYLLCLMLAPEFTDIKQTGPWPPDAYSLGNLELHY